MTSRNAFALPAMPFDKFDKILSGHDKIYTFYTVNSTGKYRA